MKKILFILFVFGNTIAYSQAPNIFPRTIPLSPAETKVDVKGLKQITCEPPNCNDYMYPVFVENFNDNFDLPNKWSFKYGYTNDDNNAGTTYMANGYFADDGITIINNNVQISSGTLKLISKQESSHGYGFTSGMLGSLNRFQYGIFEARIKIPTANKMWPAFWLLNEFGSYSEIDIFEFWDGDVNGTPCESYNDHKMSIHEGVVQGLNQFHMTERYPLSDINNFHTYKLVWDKYEISIYVDNQKKGHATKYYDNKVWDPNTCHFSGPASKDPLNSYNCSSIQNLPDNWFQVFVPTKPNNWPWWLPWPTIPQFIYHPNKIWNSIYFPSDDRQMRLIISNNINKDYKTHSFAMFTEAEQTMEIDWVQIHQPFCCGIDKTITTVNEYDISSNYTGFLTGRVLKIGTNVGSANFIQLKPENNDWRDVPFFFIATDEIQINSEAKFEGNIYTEMRITDCNGAGLRINNNSNNDNDQIINNQSAINYKELSAPKIDSIFKEANKLDIYPVPSADQITIKCDDSTFEKIVSLTLIDINGKKYSISKTKTIDLQTFDSGFYQLTIIFNDNSSITKRVIKL